MHDYLINKTDRRKLLLPGVPERKILQFHSRLPGYAPTPLHSLPDLAAELGVADIRMKDESFRFGLKAFKSLGASWAIHRILTDKPGDHHFCTATDGNHGRAVAWAAKMEGCRSDVFVPEHTVLARIEAIRNEGANVTVIAGDYDETVMSAQKAARENHWILIQDSSWEGYTEIPRNIASGYSTVLLEMEEELFPENDPNVDLVVVTAGVGTWAAAVATYLYRRYSKPPKILCVEPYESDCMLSAIKQDGVFPIRKSLTTIMAGLNCGTASLLAFHTLKYSVDAFISIEDRWAEYAMRKLYHSKIPVISGESGSAGMAGLLSIIKDPDMEPVREYLGVSRETRILLFNTEGDTDPESFKRIVGIT